MIKIGILGAGPISHSNTKRLAPHFDRCQITAIADPNPQAAEKLASQFNGAQTHATLEPMLDSVDAVMICSPNWLHPEHAITSAQAGKHLFIEKPMALSTQDADAIVKAIDQAKVTSMIGFSVRFDPTVVELKKRFENGDIGDWYSIWSRRFHHIPIPEGHWRQSFLKSGGVMSELTTHEIDWIINTVGFPKTVYCRRQSNIKDHPKANDHIWMTFGFDDPANEKTGTIEGGQASLLDGELNRGILGTKGSLYTPNWGNKLFFKNAPKETQQIECTDPFDKFGHWIDVIEGKCESVADAHYAARLVTLIEKALESAVTGNVIEL